MKCISCGADTVESTTSDVTDLQKSLIIIRNTPCRKCTECNEIIYTGDVVKRLALIVKNVTQFMNEIAVFDYRDVAA
ncbi:MAG: YgiT-type zinc finger protein [Defluviitaleaceae bacterium]|nr:YgiT-type zinc finger protein [Defluviitaleaceae bacterium]